MTELSNPGTIFFRAGGGRIVFCSGGPRMSIASFRDVQSQDLQRA